MLKAAWYRVVTAVSIDSFGEPGSTLLYVGLMSTWGSVNGDLMFFPFSWEGSINGTLMDINGLVSHWLLRWSISIHRNLVGEHRGGMTYRGL